MDTETGNKFTRLNFEFFYETPPACLLFDTHIGATLLTLTWFRWKKLCKQFEKPDKSLETHVRWTWPPARFRIRRALILNFICTFEFSAHLNPT